MNLDNNKKLSAEEYKNRAEAYKAAYIKQWKTFLKTGIFVIGALIVLLATSIAWFVNNTKVGGDGVNVSVQVDSLFEIATLKDNTKQGVFDNNSEADSNLAKGLKTNYLGQYNSFQDLPSFFEGGTTYIYEGQTYILGNTDGISLMVNETGNLSNNQEDMQMGPGSRGKFTFYIIPKTDKLNGVTVSIALDGYTIEESDTDATEGKAVELRNSALSDEIKSNILNCIQGHLLLYKGKDETGNYTDQVIPSLTTDNRIIYTIAIDKDSLNMYVPYPVTLYWIWPRHFEGMIFPGSSESIFATSCDGQDAMIDRLNNYKNLIFSSTEELQNITDTEAMTNAQLMAWSRAYNSVDQLIGNHVAFFKWEINATN